MPKIPELQVVEDAVNGVVMKINSGAITGDDIGDIVELFLRLSCTLNNQMIDMLPKNSNGKMAFADMLYDLSEDMRENSGKARGL